MNKRRVDVEEGDKGKEGERRKTRKTSEFVHNADACWFEADR
jgi:hypothetical protein